MFLNFFYDLKKHGLPVSLHEYLTLMEALKKKLTSYSIDDFYSLSKIIMVKHESQLDRFDRVFGHHFKGLEAIPDDFFEKKIPKSWLLNQLMNHLSEEEKAAIEKMGGLDALMERFRELLEEQQGRHAGGNKWIGSGGTSPFGANGYHPEGFRVGQDGNRNKSAIKVWDKRQFKN
ncbi:MAG: VWA domain-containing protein, partial [Bacteroidota bacterium]